METIIEGDIIQHKMYNTRHVVDTCQTVDDITVVYTEDVKCFMINDVFKVAKSRLASIFLKKIKGENLSNDETNYIDTTLQKLKPVKIGDIPISDFLK
jgi:hypothetical protein